MRQKQTVLIINEDAEMSSVLSNVLSNLGYTDHIELSYKRGMAWLLAGNSPFLTLLSITHSGGSGLQFLTYLRDVSPAVPVVVVGSSTQIRLIVEAVQLGASDYLVLPFDVQQARLAIGHALEDKKRNEVMSAVPDVLSHGVFGNTEMTRACEIAKIVAPTDAPVLITGESGVGKEIFARFVHRRSQRAGKPFIKVNCAALPNDLLESELFGYERGAFTGAIGDKPGKFELANGGTILLDEIAEMSPQLQAKLLHVLQDGEYSRLGGKRQLHADARILASTNRNLEEAVSRGEFRDDLYFRLNVIRIKVPPLRERKQEIPLLGNYFVHKYRDKYGSTMRELPPAILQKLADYDWPGNVRQLENAIRRYLILPELDIEFSDLPEKHRQKQFHPSETAAPVPVREATQQVSVSYSLPAEFSSLKEVGLLAAEQAEREVVLRMLTETDWNRKVAARRLNICYKALLNKIKKWQISPPLAPPARVSRRKTDPDVQIPPESLEVHAGY